MAHTFISYAREDAAFVEGELAPELEDRGEAVWIDVEDIRGGAADWRASVWAGIEGAKAVVFVLSPASLTSTVCAEELEHAEGLNKRIVPALLESVDGAALPAALERPNWVPARDFGALRAALELDEAWLDTHARLTQRTTEWKRHDRDGSYLLRGSDLRAAERWLDEQPGHREPPTADQILYVTTGGRAAARRVRSLLAGVLLALAVTAGLAVVALVARARAIDREQTAKAQAFAAQATAAIESGDVEASLRDVLRAAEIRPDAGETVFTLRRALSATGWTALLRPSRGARVTDVEFSPDGRKVATASADGTVALWDGAHRRLSLRAAGVVNTVQFSPDGRELLTASDDGTARTWDSATGRPRQVLRAGAPVWAATYGGAFIFTAGQGLATVWDAGTGQVVERLGREGQPGGSARLSEDGRRVVTSAGRLATLWGVGERRLATLRMGDEIDYALFSADARRVVTSDTSGALAVWSGRRRLALIEPAQGAVEDMDFSRDGRRVVAAFANGVARVWDAASGDRLARLAGESALRTVQFDRRGDFVVTGGDDGIARVWRVASPRRPLAVLSGHTAPILRARLSPDGLRVVSGSLDGSARVWPARARTPLAEDWTGADAVQFAPDSRHALLVRDGQRGVWDTATGRVVNLRGGITSGDQSVHPCGLPAGCTPFSPDSRSVAGVTRNARAVIWDARSGEVKRPLAGAALGAAFSPDGRGVVVVGADQPAAHVIDPSSGRTVGEAKAPDRDTVATAQYAGRRVITVGTSWRARLTDLVSGASPQPIDDVLPRAIAGSRRRVALATTTGGLLLLDGTAPPRKVGRERFYSVALDRQGTAVAGGGDGVTQLWDTRTLASVRLTAPGSQVSGVQFSPDGTLVLVTSGAVARLWDRALGREVASLPATPEARAQFSPDGTRIALSGADRVEVLACAACAARAELERRAAALLAEGDPQARRIRQRDGA